MRGQSTGSGTPTRREFLRTSAGATTALAIGGSIGTVSASVPTPRLYVDGKWVKDPAGNVVTLRGFNIADPHWYDTKAAWLGKTTIELLEWVTDEDQGWYPSIVRLPVTQDSVSEAGGYDAYIENHLRPAVDFLGEQGVYAIVDNHIIRPYTAAATDDANDSYDQYPDDLVRDFWTAMAPEFAADDHVLYELFNEPIGPRGNGVESWNTWRETAQPWVDLITEHAPATPVIVGSPRWCQLTNYVHENPFVQDNLIYAAHIYTQENMRPWAEYFGDTVAEYPVINSEWGWDGTSEAYVDQGTRENYGAPLKEWMSAHDNVHWTAWCLDPEWGPTMVEKTESGEWQLLGGSDHHGQFVKEWLAETKAANVPQVASGETPFSGGVPDDDTAPPAPESLSVGRTTEETVELSWPAVTDDGDAGLAYYVLYRDGDLDRKAADQLTATTVSGLDSGPNYEFAVTAVDRAGNESPATTVTVETVARDARQSAYVDNPVPGRIQAEDFDTGGNGIAYRDTTPGNSGGLYRETDVDIEDRPEDSYSIGWISDGEWWEYTVTARVEATYAVHVRFASGQNGGQLNVAVDGDPVGDTNVWNTGGWADWTTLRVGEVDLTPGEHVVRVTAPSGGWNYDYVEFEAVDDITIPADETLPPAPTGLSIADRDPLTVTWDAVSDTESGLDHYRVSVDGSQATTVAAGTRTATLEPSAGSVRTLSVVAVDGAGNTSDPATLSLDGEGPGPIGDSDVAPTDPDGDGLYEDVSGDGDLNFPDVNTLFQHTESAAVQDDPTAFDFDGDGDVDLQDVLALFERV